jgi:hypothetical protein
MAAQLDAFAHAGLWLDWKQELLPLRRSPAGTFFAKPLALPANYKPEL